MKPGYLYIKPEKAASKNDNFMSVLGSLVSDIFFIMISFTIYTVEPQLMVAYGSLCMYCFNCILLSMLEA